jgi:hypothetical protein
MGRRFKWVLVIAVALTAFNQAAPAEVTADTKGVSDQANTSESVSNGLHSLRIVDVLNLFSNVGALIYFVEPNDFGCRLASSVTAPARSSMSGSFLWPGTARPRPGVCFHHSSRVTPRDSPSGG